MSQSQTPVKQYRLIMNADVKPALRNQYKKYDFNVIEEILKTCGITNCFKVSRTEVNVSSSSWSFAQKTVTHSELCFELPSEEAYVASQVGLTGLSYVSMLNRLPTMINGVEAGSIASPKLCVDIAQWHPLAGDVLKACQEKAFGLDINFQDGGIEVGTRDNGDFEHDRPGEADIKRVREFVADIRKIYPKIISQNASCDEWTCIAFMFSDMNEESLSKA